MVAPHKPISGVRDQTAAVCALKIGVDKEATVVVRFKPIIQMNLVQIRGDDFLAEFVGLRAQERCLFGKPAHLSTRPPSSETVALRDPVVPIADGFGSRFARVNGGQLR